MRRQTMLMVVIAGIAFSQQRTASAQDAEPDPRGAIAYDLPSPWDADLTLSWQTLGLRGSDQRYFKYHRPPDGSFVGGLALRGTHLDGFPSVRLSAFNLGEEDTGAQFVWHGQKTPASLRWEIDRFQFYADPVTGAAVSSKRMDNALRLNYDLPGRLPLVEVGFHHQQLSEPSIARLGGMLGFDSQELTLRTALDVGPGRLTLSYANLDFTDDALFLPPSQTDSFAASYSFDPNRSTSLSALWAKMDIEQAGTPFDTEIEQWQLQGSYHPRPQFSLSAKYGQRMNDQLNTQNAYTQQVDTAEVRARYRPLSALTVRAGVTRNDFERVDRAHAFLDAPMRETTWLSVRAHLAHDVRLIAKYRKQDLEDVPGSSIPNAPDLSPLYRNDRDVMDLRASGPVGQHGVGYVFFTADDVRNGLRGLHFKTDTVGLGLQSQLSQRWSMSADGYVRNQRRGNAASLGDPFRLNGGLSSLADSEAYTVSTTYELNDVTSLSGYFTKYRGRGGALIDDHEFGFALRRDLADDLSFGIEWYRVSHDDNDPGVVPFAGLDFNDNRLRIDLTAGF